MREAVIVGRLSRSTIAAAVLLAMEACAGSELRPASDAVPAPLRGEAAVAEDAGVQVAASTGAWQARPANLETELTPVLVEVLNRSGRPLRIAYDAFRFTTEAGRSYAALPPYDIEGEVVRPVPGGRPYYPHARFGGAPYLGGYYPQLGLYGGPLAFSNRHYGAYLPMWGAYRAVQLPTEDMLERALPEGVVESGGRVGGFLYFQKIVGGGPFEFHADLVDAGTGEQFGTIGIPFVSE